MHCAKQHTRLVALNPDSKSPLARDFETRLRSLIIGQEAAVRSIASLYQFFHAGMSDPSRPLGTMLLLGPTGSGKTRVVEATAEILFGDANTAVKIDCAEFQHPHEIARLIGAPPGYLGHRETDPLLTQENLDKHRTRRDPFSILLFDEIEKATEALWQLLLGILDKATLRLGDNRRVDFSQTMIFMTSNLGAKEMSEIVTGTLGFAPARSSGLFGDQLDQKLHRTAFEAAGKTFSPEFMNRIDRVVVFRSLKHEELRQILDLELKSVQRRIEEGGGQMFTFTLTEAAKAFLLVEGTDYRYGARHLKRAIERLLVYPLANLSASGQVRLMETVVVDLDQQRNKLVFYRDETKTGLVAAAVGKQAERKRSWFDMGRAEYGSADMGRPIL
ncbi:MAG: AAA family ATPase [Acidobacteriota bacterium]